MLQPALTAVNQIFGPPCQECDGEPAFIIADHTEKPTIWWTYERHRFLEALTKHREYYREVEQVPYDDPHFREWWQLEVADYDNRRNLFTLMEGRLINKNYNNKCICGKDATIITSLGKGTVMCSNLECYYALIRSRSPPVLSAPTFQHQVDDTRSSSQLSNLNLQDDFVIL